MVKSDTCLPVFAVAGQSDLSSVKFQRVHLSQESDNPRGIGPKEEEEECLKRASLKLIALLMMEFSGLLDLFCSPPYPFAHVKLETGSVVNGQSSSQH